jgi:putative endonuclease
MMANKPNGTLYVGVTANLPKRQSEHHDGHGSSFTSTYGLDALVWFEYLPTMSEAIEREKQLKHWNRAWKIQLIEKENPDWEDLSFRSF